MPSLPESVFQTQVENLAAHYGWRCFHAPDNRPTRTKSGRIIKQRVTPGFPDLVLVRDQELIFAELKTAKGRIRPAQSEWIAALENVGAAVRRAANHSGLGPTYVSVDVYLWRPADFDDLHARLARGRVRIDPLYRDAAA